MTRKNLQEQIISDTLLKLSNNQNQIIFSEIKTGTGKTKILLETAFKQMERTQKSVLISTSNNFLVLEYLKEAEKFGFSKDKIAILIGKDNYLDTSLIDDDFLKEYNLNKDEVDKWIEEHSDFLLTSLFIDYFALPEEVGTAIEGSKDEENTINSRAFQIVNDEPKVYITNHYFLIYLLQSAKVDDFFNTDIFADEVHLLNNTAKTIFKKSFSPYRLAFLLRRLHKDSINNRVKKPILILSVSAESLLENCRKYAQKESESVIGSVFDKLEGFLSSSYYSDAKKAIKDIASTNRIAKLTLREMYEAESILKSKQSAEISFSPVKGNISFATIEENPINRLKSLVSKHNGNFWGVSGTIRVDLDESISANKWSFERLGFHHYKEPSSTKDFAFNHKINNIVFKVYPSIFSKNQTRYYIANDEKFLPIRDMNSSDAKKKYVVWVENLASLAKDVFWNSGLILMSSYENVELVEQALQKNGFTDKYLIFAQKFGANMRTVVKRYKEAIDNGEQAVLIGGLNFYTGVDLSGKYLNTLFIGKLPLEPKTDYYSKRKYGSYSSQVDLRKNGLLTFRQGIGRAIRSEEDRALIVIADPRVETSRYKAFKEFLDEMAYPVDVQ